MPSKCRVSTIQSLSDRVFVDCCHRTLEKLGTERNTVAITPGKAATTEPPTTTTATTTAATSTISTTTTTTTIVPSSTTDLPPPDPQEKIRRQSFAKLFMTSTESIPTSIRDEDAIDVGVDSIDDEVVVSSTFASTSDLPSAQNLVELVTTDRGYTTEDIESTTTAVTSTTSSSSTITDVVTTTDAPFVSSLNYSTSDLVFDQLSATSTESPPDTLVDREDGTDNKEPLFLQDEQYLADHPVSTTTTIASTSDPSSPLKMTDGTTTKAEPSTTSTTTASTTTTSTPTTRNLTTSTTTASTTITTSATTTTTSTPNTSTSTATPSLPPQSHGEKHWTSEAPVDEERSEEDESLEPGWEEYTPEQTDLPTDTPSVGESTTGTHFMEERNSSLLPINCTDCNNTIGAVVGKSGQGKNSAHAASVLHLLPVTVAIVCLYLCGCGWIEGKVQLLLSN